MTIILKDSLQKYGSIGSAIKTGWNNNIPLPSLSSLATSLAQGGWNVFSNDNYNITVAAGIASSDISSIRFTRYENVCYITRTLQNNISRIMGFFWVKPGGVNNQPGVTFYDGYSAQCSIVINQYTGFISLRTGDCIGAVMSTSSTALTAGQGVCVAFDISIGASASYQLWINNISAFSGVGNTRGGTSNSYVNFIGIGYTINLHNLDFVDFSNIFINDNTGSTNNTVLLTSPVIKVDYAITDNSTQFTQTAITIGSSRISNILFSSSPSITSWSTPGANTLFLRPFTSSVNMTLNGVSCIPQATSIGANFKAVIYADNAGNPDTLIATGTIVTDSIENSVLTSLFESGQALTGGTQYWLGFITDTAVSLWIADVDINGRIISNTYSSGAPNPAGSMTTGYPNWAIWGSGTGGSQNYAALNNDPPIGLSYNQSATVGQQDLFTFSGTITGQVYGVGLSILASNPGGGTRTGNGEISSSGTLSAGNNPGWSPGSTPIWYDTWIAEDPATNSAWTSSAVNAALGGPKVAS